MGEMARANAGMKDGKAPGGDGIPAEAWKHGGDKSVQQTAPTNHQCLGDGFCTTSMEGCQHHNSSFHTRQDLRKDPPQLTIYPHNTRGSSGDVASEVTGAPWI